MTRALLLVLALAAWSSPAAALTWAPRYDAAAYRSSVANYVRWFHKAARADRLAAALELVDPVVDVALEHGVNPALIAAIVTLESSWRPAAIGELGERGLMQMMRGGASSPRAQLEQGVELLVKCHERCKTVAGAISLYATGRSCRTYHGAEIRVRLAERIEEEF